MLVQIAESPSGEVYKRVPDSTHWIWREWQHAPMYNMSEYVCAMRSMNVDVELLDWEIAKHDIF